MNTAFWVHSGIFVLAVVGCFLALFPARRIQHRETRLGMQVFLAACVLWASGYLGYLIAPSPHVQYWLYLVGFIFAFVAVGSWMFFAAAYTGRSPWNVPFRKWLLAAFIGVILLKLTNPFHHQFFSVQEARIPFAHLAIAHGPLHWIVLGLSYAIIAVGFFMLFERFLHAGANTRPLMVLIGLTAVPVGFTILGEFTHWVLPLMYEPIGVAAFALGTLFVYFDRFNSIQFTTATSQPTIVLDRNTDIREYNAAARAVFPKLSETLGEPVSTLIPDLPALDQVSGHIIDIDQTASTRRFELTKTPITTSSTVTGWILTCSDVTQRERYREEIELKNHQLEALNRVIRHDIRNDMMVILGWSQALKAEQAGIDSDKIDRIIQSSEHVVELTETARAFVDALADDTDLDRKPIALDRVLDNELEIARSAYPQAEIRTETLIPAVTIPANELLSSIFRNVLNNAIQHNDSETPTVTVSVVEQPSSVRIHVRDNGPGIPAHLRESIFGKGEKGIDSEGSGIGLYLVATLVSQFDGEVWVDDNEPRGSDICIELPTMDGPCDSTDKPGECLGA